MTKFVILLVALSAVAFLAFEAVLPAFLAITGALSAIQPL